MNENILLHYALERDFNNTPLNAVGATTSTTLRTVDTISGDTAYVRKFGTDYLITNVTDIEDPIDVNMKFAVFALDGTLLGSRTGGGAFSAGSSVTAQGCYLEIVASGGAVTVLASITIDTDIDVGGLAFVCPAETIADGDTLRLYLSDTSSTYYDSGLIYGGDRHTPVLDNTRLPYFHPVVAYAALNSANDGVVVLDSATYEMDAEALSRATTFLLAASGQNPTITKGIGARATRSTTQEYNNTTAIYFNTNGNDSNDGTWQNPVLTLSKVDTLQGAGSKHAIYGGTGAVVSGIFNESKDFAAITGIKLEADYFYMPVLQTSTGAIGNIDFHGINFNGLNVDTNIIIFTNSAAIRFVIDCTFENTITNAAIFSAASDDFTINNCRFLNNDLCFFIRSVIDTSIVNIKRNIFENYINGIKYHQVVSGATVNTINIENNIFNSKNINHDYDILIFPDYPPSPVAVLLGNFNNNIFIDGINDSIRLEDDNGSQTLFDISAINIDNNIIMDKAKGINNDNASFTIIAENNCFFNNTLDKEGPVTNTSPINANPKLCSITNKKFGIQPISPCYRAGNDSDDVGIKTRIIEINESNITINGFIIDGQNAYSAGIFIVDTADHIGTLLKWNSIINHIGQPIDLYDDATNLDAQILNNNINNNGTGITLKTGGNIIKENLIYKNSQQGIYSNGIGDQINHNVLFLNNQGLYFDIGSNPLIIKNNIIAENSTFGIFSEVSIASGNIINNDMIDSVSAIVNITNISNIIANPLFIDTITIGSENFNIKTRQTNIIDSDGNIIGQYTSDSPCKNAGDDGFDIGAFKVDRNISLEFFQKFQLFNNPFELNPDKLLKGSIDFENDNGDSFKLGKSHKWVFPFIWADDDDQTEEQVDVIRDIATLAETDENGLFADKTDVRIHVLPTAFLLSKSLSGVVDPVEKTISDTSLSLRNNKFKGFHVGIKFFEDTNLVIDATAKTGTKAGAGWTIDEHKGRYIYDEFNYFFILSNTSSVLSLSDPFSELIDKTIVNFAIEQYFKIIAHSKNQFVLEDKDNELIAGTFSYYIDFIVCQVMNDNFQPIQEGYFWNRHQSKTGFELLLQEK